MSLVIGEYHGSGSWGGPSLGAPESKGNKKRGRGGFARRYPLDSRRTPISEKRWAWLSKVKVVKKTNRETNHFA